MNLSEICAGRISSGFGWRLHPITKERQFHNGIDIAARQGTSVFAPIEGRVASVYRHPTGGLTLILTNERDVRVGMCHLQSVEKQAGDRVSVGDCVAKVGNTGRTTGAHLHLTVSIDGNWLDPSDVFQDGSKKG